MNDFNVPIARHHNLLRTSLVWLAMVVGLVTILTGDSRADDWPQFLGLHRDAKSAETGLSRSWPAAGPKVLWTVPLGEGFGGPAVKDGKVYLVDRVEDQQDVLRCFDLSTGKELWKFAYDAPGRFSHNGSRSVPTVDDNAVYIVGPFGQMHCVSLATHQPLWKADLVKDFDARVLQWGLAQNPLLYENLVIVAPMGHGAGVVAMARETGKVVWKSPYLPGTMADDWHGSYVSPDVGTLAGTTQVVIVTASQGKDAAGKTNAGVVAGISAADGSVLWTYDGFQAEIAIPPATILPGDRVFATGAYGGGGAMVKIEKTGDKFVARELFKTRACGSQIQRPIAHDNCLFISSNGKERREGLLCLSFDGQLRWHTTNSRFAREAKPDLPNFDVGNLILADGMIFILDGKKGDLRLVEPSPDGYKELACAPRILSGIEIWSPMALSDGKLLIRDQSQMKCLDVRR
jgi:outer membrane protein assembly factor BamB